jgi:two-component system LytT family response regulator
MIVMTRRHHETTEESSPWVPLPEEPTLRLRTDQVAWISAAGNYCEFHTRDRVHLVRVSLVSMAERLKTKGFARVHRSAVVNMSTIESIERSSTPPRSIARLRCGTTVPVGRRFHAGLLAAADSHSAQQ